MASALQESFDYIGRPLTPYYGPCIQIKKREKGEEHLKNMWQI